MKPHRLALREGCDDIALAVRYSFSGCRWQPRATGGRINLGSQVGLITLDQPRLSEGAQPYPMHLAATRHLRPPPEVLLSHFCTFARGIAVFAPLHFVSASPATRLPKLCLPLLHLCTRLRRICTFALLPISPLAHVSPYPRVPLPTCPLAAPPRSPLHAA